MDASTIEKQLTEKLNDSDTYELARYLLLAGAGFVPMHGRDDTQIAKKKKTLQSMIWALTDALNDPHPTEWETEIGKLVMSGDIDQMRKLARRIHADNPQCPVCRRSARVRYRESTREYTCDFSDCKSTWKI